MDKGTELNKRVWALFEKAGFHTKPNKNEPTEHKIRLLGGVKKPVDLYATLRTPRVVIVGSNKSGPKIHGFFDHVAGLADLRDSAAANVGLLVLTERELDRREKSYLTRKRIHVWGERELSYYEAVAKALGTFAKYELIYSFGVPTQEQTLKATLPAVKLEQPGRKSSRDVELYAFSIPVDFLLKTCVILRKARGSAFAYQRMLTKKRLPRIGDFVDKPDALLPTNIVVHLGSSVVVEKVHKTVKNARGKVIDFWETNHNLVALTIPLRYGSLEIIDGQHRLFGFIYSKKKNRESFRVVVVGIKDISEERRTKTFVAINDKARRVDPSLVAYLRHTDSERICKNHADLMAIKVVVELNKKPPFKNAIRLFDYGPQEITLKGFYGYDLKGMVGPNGLLRKYYPNTSHAFVGALRTYFTVLSELFEKEWKEPKTYIIPTNRGISAFLKLLKSILKNEQARITKETARKYLQPVKERWIKRTWVRSKLHTSYTASQGWKQFHRDLVKTVKRKYTHFME